MSLKIRLSRCGSKKDPHYSVVVIESTKARDGKFVEKIGHYHPKLHNDARVFIDQGRWNYWKSVGACPTEVVIKLASILNFGDLPQRIYCKSKTHGVSKKEQKNSTKK